MLGKDFRGLAEAVTRTYGDDPWFFLRELAQNSRDASAKAIRVEAQRSADGLESLTFADDGRGMRLAHARRFLFRLYASHKSGDKMSAGKYGIGFWTILRFQPSQICLQSRCGKESWAVVMDAELRARPTVCPLDRPGTTVILTRPAVFATEAEFSQEAEHALRAYCGFLRRNDRLGTLLPVYFHGQNLTVPMSLPGPLSYAFHDGAVEGAVAVDENPRVRLFARGLPVWEGALLEQMSHLQAIPPSPIALGQGLAPVFLLNGNRLDVTFSRNLVLENRALWNVRRRAEKALRRLLADSLERAFPRKWYQRLGQIPRSLFGRLARPGWKPLLLSLLVILPLEIVILSRFFPGRTVARPFFFSLRDDAINYPGAAVAISSSQASARFAYSPPVPGWFKVFVAADYDLKAGFIRRPGWVTVPPPFQGCEPENVIRIRLAATEAGRTLLPVPPGYAIDPDSLFFAARQRLALDANAQDEYGTEVPAGAGEITYNACPLARVRELTPVESARLTALPEELELPPALARSLAKANSLAPAEKVAHASALARESIRYDTSLFTAQAYQRRPAGQSWLAGVLAIGRGDCDIINGFNVLLLRKLGIPARMVIGLVGSRGRILPGLHAWSEYFDGGWQIIDPSAGAASALSPPQAAAVPGQASQESPALPSPESGPGNGSRLGLLALGLAVMAMLLSLAAVYRRRSSLVLPSGMAGMTSDAGKELLLPLIQQALLQPEKWGRENPLWDHPFLPTVGSKPMSIRRALALLRRNRLLVATSQNPLAAALKDRGLPILDLHAKLFAPLLNLLPGAVNLDLLYRLRPQPPGHRGAAQPPGHRGPAQPPGRTGAGSDDFLASVNKFLYRKFTRPTICLLAPGLQQADLLAVSLPAVPRQKGLFFPQRFIAVNPTGKRFNELAELFKKNRPLALLRFLQTLHGESLLPATNPETLLKKSARRLLREYRGIKK
ncbi:MAG: ATP-binding protein [Candidatus Aminicenantes bacterium]|nr:ATP-binding protein [Candidatus Aminicenantes bacterium]